MDDSGHLVEKKPTRADILTAISKAQTGDWLDPCEKPAQWTCTLYNPEGKRVGNGNARTAKVAMGLAWLCAWAPDALIEAYVEPNTIPLDVPDGWRFELTPPHPARALRWHGFNFSAVMAENWLCPHCGGRLRPSDIDLHGVTVNLTCSRCHVRPLEVELRCVGGVKFGDGEDAL